MNTFAVGEVGIVVCYDWSRIDPECRSYIGQEVTVFMMLGNGYGVRAADGTELAVTPDHLRKRRPPQDWVSLCKLEERPVEEIA